MVNGSVSQVAGPQHCGLDFGTSNSTLCVAAPDGHFLVPVDGAYRSIPSAIFFGFGATAPAYGRDATDHYMAGESGRLMRALKSVIGRPVFHERTRIGKRHIALADILGLFLAHLKRTAEQHVGRDLPSVVLGRPVQFIDDSTEHDRQAQRDLEQTARQAGFKYIEFQFEPIAAALEYEAGIGSEKLVLVIDLGGGTSDFSIVRVSPERAKAQDRSADVLANRGIRIGGTDFDRRLSLQHVMPHFGYGSLYGAKQLEVPKGLFVDLSTWSNINALYEHRLATDVRAMRKQSAAPRLLDRLVATMLHHSGHRLLADVEKAKIRLTDDDRAQVLLDYIEPGFAVSLSDTMLVDAVENLIEKIRATILLTLADAGTSAGDIDAVFLTGGSTMARPVRAMVSALFPDTDIVIGDVFGAVGKGLGLDADRRFGDGRRAAARR